MRWFDRGTGDSGGAQAGQCRRRRSRYSATGLRLVCRSKAGVAQTNASSMTSIATLGSCAKTSDSPRSFFGRGFLLVASLGVLPWSARRAADRTSAEHRFDVLAESFIGRVRSCRRLHGISPRSALEPPAPDTTRSTLAAARYRFGRAAVTARAGSVWRSACPARWRGSSTSDAPAA